MTGQKGDHMQEAIAALAQWEVYPANDVVTPASLPTPTPDAQAGGARLSELLVAPVDGGGMTIEMVPGVPPPEQGHKVMGDIILAKLDAIGTEYRTNVSQAYDVLEKSPKEVTLQEMMKLQLDMAVVTLEIEVVGKGVQKAVQHVDTLAKIQ